jgi:hypothetical protein
MPSFWRKPPNSKRSEPIGHNSAISGTSNNTNGVSTLGQTADSNYNQQQMQDVLNKLDEFLNAARR